MLADSVAQRAAALVARPKLCSISADLAVPVAVLVAGVAAVPRFWNLTVQDPFVDETTWIHWAIDLFNVGDPSTYWIPIQISFRPPLFYWLITFTTNLSDNAIVGGRLGAALPDVVTAVGLYFLGRSLFSAHVGALAGLLWALNPYPLFFARIASDDALLTCFAVLTSLAAVAASRRPSVTAGLVLGVLFGLTVLTKTIGLTVLGWIALALLTFGGQNRIARLLCGFEALAVAALLLLPLVPWTAQLQHGADLYIAVPGQDVSARQAVADPLGAALMSLNALLKLDQLSHNWSLFVEWVSPLVGVPVILLAPASLALAGRRVTRAHFFLVALSLCTTVAVLDRAQILFSRYFLFLTFPAFLLAADALVRMATLLARDVRVRAAVLGCALLGALAPTVPMLVRIDTDPAAAALSSTDHYQYFEQWYALFGFGRVVEYLKDQAREAGAPVTVLVPPNPYRFQPLLPASPLMASLRHDSSVRFQEEPSLVTAASLCDLRAWAQRGPTFFVLNGAYALALGDGLEVPGFTRRIEAGLARDLPGATAVLRIPRPSVPVWLTLYRLDTAEKTQPKEGTCLVARHVFDDRWRGAGAVPGTGEELRGTSDRAGYWEGPLPHGLYRPIIWARELSSGTSVRVLADGQDLGLAQPVEQGGAGWRWLAPPKTASVEEGARVQLQFEVVSTGATDSSAAEGPPSELVVRDLVLQREPDPESSRLAY